MSVAADAATAAFAAGVAVVAEALRTAANDPADQVALLSQLADLTPPATTNTSPIGVSTATAQSAVAALCRRTALISLARACAAYQPTSSSDAQAVQASVVALFDAEITIAADDEDDTSYLALRVLRTAVVNDLTTRGANLPALRTITTAEPQPALVLGYLLYQDATRSDDLIVRVNPIHPAFMPTTFNALSS